MASSRTRWNNLQKKRNPAILYDYKSPKRAIVQRQVDEQRTKEARERLAEAEKFKRNSP